MTAAAAAGPLDRVAALLRARQVSCPGSLDDLADAVLHAARQTPSTPRPATSEAVAATLYAAHSVADHWVQTHLQARDKSIPGRIGRLACARHVAGYHLTAAAMLAVTAAALALPLRPGWVAAGLAVSAVTHYLADRRAPLARLARLARVDGFHRVAGGGLNGAYLLDQSWHHAWLWVAALVIAAGSAR